MKTLMKFFASLFLGCILLTACGSSTESKLAGTWVMEGSGMRIDVEINRDGTGEISLAGQENGKWYPIMRKEPITYRIEDDIFYYNITESDMDGNLLIKDGQLYTNDGQPFTKK